MSNYNVGMKVTDGGIWWENVKQTQGWKLQKHSLTGHYRIINPSKIRKAWSSDRQEMIDIFNDLTYVEEEPVIEKTVNTQAEPTQIKPSKQEVLAQLKDLGELYENSVLTKAEFENAKKKLLKEL